jgi:UDP-N-acetylmuramoyl-L-alanyl-D-glutamate--2,6-diaminopimelate ligase
MKLNTIQRALGAENLLVEGTESGTSITAVTDDSRRVGVGALFCAVDGTALDGHDFLEDAVECGAAAALVTRRSDVSLPQIVVTDGRRAAGVAAREWFGNPASRMSLIGVTGTNGKTTTVAIAWHLLNASMTAGRIGTLGAFDGANQRLTGYASLTTPGPVEFHAVLADLESRGVSTVVMEASSHGLDQGRLEGATFTAAVYTNLTHEHLDYHATLEDYAAAKMKLSGLLAADGLEIVNADDPVWHALPRRPGIRRLLFGRETGADLRTTSERLSANGSESRVCFGAAEYSVMLPMLGEFNVSNALAAAATAWGLGEDPAAVAVRLASIPTVPGRMEMLASGAFTVLRDYAHTPDGFQRAIETIKAITPGRLVVLFGVGGDRDREKRPVMGRIAADGADLVVLTEDNPRTEDPESTIDDIEAGMGNTEHLRIRDREQGIRTALSLLEEGDCLLLLGKGHETYQIIGTEKLPFDERTIVESAIRELM